MKNTALPIDIHSDRMVEIIYKASRIFYGKSFDGTSMDDIAKAMNLTKAALYYYVESKEDLLYKIMNYGLDWVDREIIEPAKGISDPFERLNWAVRRHARQMLEGSGAMAIVAEEIIALNQSRRKQIAARRQVYVDMIHAAIMAMKAQGKLRDIEPLLATHSLFGMLLWLPRWYQPETGISTTRAIDNVTTLFFNGLFKDSNEKGA